MEPMDLGGKSVEKIFYEANFIRDLDIHLEKVGAGTCETSLVVQERLRQQHGFVHGGVIATMADHTAGGAARSVSGARDVLTVEFKINYLRPAIGDRLRCTASVLRAGRTMIVAEALVFAYNTGERRSGGQADGNALCGRRSEGTQEQLGPAPLFQLFRRARPVLAQQAAERPVCQQFPRGLAMRAIVGFICGVADALDLGPTVRAGLAVAAVDRHVIAKCGDFFRKLVAGVPPQIVSPLR
jgi:uncharacterized protein (TIGR00369 family)